VSYYRDGPVREKRASSPYMRYNTMPGVVGYGGGPKVQGYFVFVPQRVGDRKPTRQEAAKWVQRVVARINAQKSARPTENFNEGPEVDCCVVLATDVGQVAVDRQTRTRSDIRDAWDVYDDLVDSSPLEDEFKDDYDDDDDGGRRRRVRRRRARRSRGGGGEGECGGLMA
jgi:hypothetical protein